jgi:hypothetical protein
MPVVEYQSLLQSALLSYLSKNRGAAGRRDYYGVSISSLRVSKGSLSFILTLTFKSPQTYCCFEPGCHTWFFSRESWEELRRCLEEEGIGDAPPLTLRKLRGKVEAGARAAYGGMLKGEQAIVKKGYRYEVGLYTELQAHGKK